MSGVGIVIIPASVEGIPSIVTTISVHVVIIPVNVEEMPVNMAIVHVTAVIIPVIAEVLPANLKATRDVTETRDSGNPLPSARQSTPRFDAASSPIKTILPSSLMIIPIPENSQVIESLSSTYSARPLPPLPTLPGHPHPDPHRDTHAD